MMLEVQSLKILNMKLTKSDIFKDLGKYDILELEVGNFYFYDEFVVAEINEGIEFAFENSRVLFDFAIEKYKKVPFGYISNRINSYTTFPVDYKKTYNYLPSLVAFAIITYTNVAKNFTAVEKKFSKNPYQNFTKLEDAIKWVRQIVNEARLKGDEYY